MLKQRHSGKYCKKRRSKYYGKRGRLKPKYTFCHSNAGQRKSIPASPNSFKSRAFLRGLPDILIKVSGNVGATQTNDKVNMSYKFPKAKINSDGLFGPTKEKHYYFPVTYHNKTASANKHKTTWVLKQNEQFEVFRLADESKWLCKNRNGLFSILDKGQVILGSNEERLSFFPNPVNTTDPYHGYPIDSGEYDISTELVDKWLEEKIIDNRLHIKILKGQI